MDLIDSTHVDSFVAEQARGSLESESPGFEIGDSEENAVADANATPILTRPSYAYEYEPTVVDLAFSDSTGCEIVGSQGEAVADATEKPTDVPPCVLEYEPSVVDLAYIESASSIEGGLQDQMYKGIQPTCHENSNCSDEFEWFPDGQGLADRLVRSSRCEQVAKSVEGLSAMMSERFACSVYNCEESDVDLETEGKQPSTCVSTPPVYDEDQPWPEHICKIRHLEKPDGIIVMDVGAVHWCPCTGSCQTDTCTNALSDIFSASNNC
ncbi:hypothetical protein PF010_g9661 [Phytophthora fragariae]|uniref:Uncharacterized protein n=1 Tax=Phytophthora fragariae TaxID=53985 RepID=A0A6G0PDE3_9STRA|nr:hypothetical protein PF010_g9661 [Phytophthora fragariae]KAE9243406.1 hypothetical protein PF004_g6162 [Phytophthora fragariae]